MKTVELDLALYEPRDIQELSGMCKAIAASQLMPKALRGKPADVMLVAWKGRELGFTVQQSLGSIHVIEGRAMLSAEAMGALVMRSPVCEYLTLVESTNEVATYATKRAGTNREVTISFTLAQARAANLAHKPNWKAHPEAMLRARALSAIARAVYPDLVMGLYVHGEIEPEADTPHGEPVKSLADAMAEATGDAGGVIPEPATEDEPEDAAFEEVEEVGPISRQKLTALKSRAAERAQELKLDYPDKAGLKILAEVASAWGFDDPAAITTDKVDRLAADLGRWIADSPTIWDKVVEADGAA